MIKFKRIVPVLAGLSVLGLSGCFSSVFKDLLITSVKITPANPTIAIGATQQFSLVVTYVDGQTDHPSPSSTAWSSDNAAVATINKMGVATGVAAGTANIGGSYHGNDTHTVLTVTAPANVTIAVHGGSRVLDVTNLRTGQEITFAANGLRDSVMISLDGESRTASEISVLPEHGPAWLAIDLTGRYLYVLNLTSESISAFAIDWQTGTLHAVVSSPFPVGAKPLSVEVNSGGTGVSVAHFEDLEDSHFLVDPATGALTPDPK